MVTAGSLLAQTTNIGNFSRDRFSAVPEVSAKLGYQVTPNIRAFVGYDFMYWTVIIRPGDAIDTTFNPTLFPPVLFAGAARPAPRFDTSDYWVHGANIGVKATF
ncbi:MAG: BBP7 family outer membrane beta-barrel protein [Tardiphaga sp.]